MPELITWDDTLSVGIEEIDEQHKVLIGLLNELHAGVIAGNSATLCREVLDRLGEYTRIHFTTEESLLRILHYPQYERHKQEHERLLGELERLQGELDAGELISLELLDFLRGWLAGHIREVDSKYTAHFLSLGLNPELPKASWRQRLFSNWRR